MRGRGTGPVAKHLVHYLHYQHMSGWCWSDKTGVLGPCGLSCNDFSTFKITGLETAYNLIVSLTDFLMPNWVSIFGQEIVVTDCEMLRCMFSSDLMKQYLLNTACYCKILLVSPCPRICVGLFRVVVHWLMRRHFSTNTWAL